MLFGKNKAIMWRLHTNRYIANLKLESSQYNVHIYDNIIQIRKKDARTIMMSKSFSTRGN